MRMNSHSATNAAAKVNRSTAITTSMPPNANSAEANTGVRMVLSELAIDRRPLVF